MLALIDCKSGGGILRRAPEVRYETVLGMRVIRLTVRAKKPRRPGVIASALRKAGADAVCFHEGFPFKEAVSVRVADCNTLHPEIFKRICAEVLPCGKTVLLTGGGETLSTELLEILAQKYRYVQTRGLPRETVLRLRRKTGASVIENPSREKISEAEYAVFTRSGGKIELPERCAVLALCDEFLENAAYFRFLVPPELRVNAMTPEGFPRRVIIAEALRRGALRSDKIGLGPCQILTKQQL